LILHLAPFFHILETFRLIPPIGDSTWGINLLNSIELTVFEQVSNLKLFNSIASPICACTTPNLKIFEKFDSILSKGVARRIWTPSKKFWAVLSLQFKFFRRGSRPSWLRPWFWGYLIQNSSIGSILPLMLLKFNRIWP